MKPKIHIIFSHFLFLSERVSLLRSKFINWNPSLGLNDPDHENVLNGALPFHSTQMAQDHIISSFEPKLDPYLEPFNTIRPRCGNCDTTMSKLRYSDHRELAPGWES